MQFVTSSVIGNVASILISRGKVNALNETLVDELKICLETLEEEREVRAIVLRGEGKFFSFGFDIPAFLNHDRESFRKFLEKFTNLYTYLFLYPKPVVAALNGHTIAGGCMLATACDYRIMVDGKAMISLNEVTFGSSVFAGSVEMLKACVGTRNAETILLSGGMFSAQQALQLGLIDRTTSLEELLPEAVQMAANFSKADSAAFASIKKLLRGSTAEQMRTREPASISEFVHIWYSESTRNQVAKITIRQ
jgi:Delta3-Delta2-enoyl-CoA isomerase